MTLVTKWGRCLDRFYCEERNEDTYSWWFKVTFWGWLSERTKRSLWNIRFLYWSRYCDLGTSKRFKESNKLKNVVRTCMPQYLYTYIYIYIHIYIYTYIYIYLDPPKASNFSPLVCFWWLRGSNVQTLGGFRIFTYIYIWRRFAKSNFFRPTSAILSQSGFQCFALHLPLLPLPLPLPLLNGFLVLKYLQVLNLT